ncbi:11358_t:CDS:2, partial [Gigaspora rosea]
DPEITPDLDPNNVNYNYIVVAICIFIFVAMGTTTDNATPGCDYTGIIENGIIEN